MMSEQDLSRISEKLLEVLDVQEKRHKRSTKTEKNISYGVTVAALSVLAFIGTTVWDNSIAITKIEQQVNTLTTNMMDRYTGKEGSRLSQHVDILNKRVRLLETNLQDLTVKDELNRENNWAKHALIHTAIDSFHSRLTNELAAHKVYVINKINNLENDKK